MFRFGFGERRAEFRVVDTAVYVPVPSDSSALMPSSRYPCDHGRGRTMRASARAAKRDGNIARDGPSVHAVGLLNHAESR